MAGRTRWKIYLRRSIVRRARDTVSIDKQRHFAEQWLEENHIPADQVDWFVDAQGHRSARWETTRPEWMRVKSELLLPSTAGLWCFEMDRTHRNVRATAELVETAQNIGLRLVSYKDNIDTANGLNSDDLVVIMLKAALAQRESSKASERMTDAIHERVRDLGPWGTPPFGATYTGEGKIMRQITNPPHDVTMREMCRIYASGASYGETGDEMNRLGLLNLSRGKALVPWNRETVRSALHNILSLNGWRTPLKFNKDAKIVLGEGQGSAIERYAESVKAERSSKFDVVIDDALASAVVERRARAQRGQRPTIYALLTPILWMTGRDRPMYANKGHLYKTHGKPVRQIEVTFVDEVLLAKLSDLQFPVELREMIKRNVTNATNNQDTEAAGQEMRRLMRKAARLREMYAEGLIEERADFDRQYEATKTLIRDAEKRMSVSPEVDGIMQHLTMMADTLMRVTPLRRKQAIQNLFSRVEINEAGEITRLFMRDWARQAFVAIATYGLQNALDRSLTPTVASLDWLMERMAA